MIEQRRCGMGLAVLAAIGVSACGVDTDFYELQTLETSTWSLPVEAARTSDRPGVFVVRVRRVDDATDLVLYSGEVNIARDDITVADVRPEVRSDNDVRLCLRSADGPAVSLQIDPEARSAVEIPGFCE